MEILKEILIKNITTTIIDKNTEEINSIMLEIKKFQEDLMIIHKEKNSGKITEEEYHTKGTIIQSRIKQL